MDVLNNAVKDGTVEWLLEGSAPSVRYETLVYLLGRPEDGPDVREAKTDIMRTGMVPEILEKMRTDEYNKTLPRFYRDKYCGLVWQLIILAELRADGEDEVIKKYCEYILSNSQEEEGGFSFDASAKGGGRKGGVIPCLTGNMAFSLIRLGYLHDERVQKAIGWMAKYQRYDDGDSAPSGSFYERYEMCWGRHSCHMGVVKTLKAFSEIPPEERTPEVKESIEQGVKYLLKHRIYKKSHELTAVSKPGWQRFTFPLMYQTDALEILLILTKLGIRDERMDEAVELVASKQNKTGRWAAASSPLRGKSLVAMDKEQQDKWITLRALEVLKSY